jgi:hypothetical protein
MKQQKLKLPVIGIFVLLALLPNAEAQRSIWTYDPQTPSVPCPSMPECGMWVQFRMPHPWPYQAFAVEAVEQDGSEATLIISEPRMGTILGTVQK